MDPMIATCRDCGHLSHPRSRCIGYANCGCDKSRRSVRTRIAQGADPLRAIVDHDIEVMRRRSGIIR